MKLKISALITVSFFSVSAFSADPSKKRTAQDEASDQAPAMKRTFEPTGKPTSVYLNAFYGMPTRGKDYQKTTIFGGDAGAYKPMHDYVLIGANLKYTRHLEKWASRTTRAGDLDQQLFNVIDVGPAGMFFFNPQKTDFFGRLDAGLTMATVSVDYSSFSLGNGVKIKPESYTARSNIGYHFGGGFGYSIGIAESRLLLDLDYQYHMFSFKNAPHTLSTLGLNLGVLF